MGSSVSSEPTKSQDSASNIHKECYGAVVAEDDRYAGSGGMDGGEQVGGVLSKGQMRATAAEGSFEYSDDAEDAPEEPGAPFVPPVALAYTGPDSLLEHRELLCDELRERGYAMLTTSAETKRVLGELYSAGDVFFAQDPAAKSAHKSDPFKTGNANLGYVNVEPVREYIKVRPTDPEQLWPDEPSDYRERYDAAFGALFEIAETVCGIMAGEVDPESGDPVLSADTLDAVGELADKKSSISLIHYYAQSPVERSPDEFGDYEVCATHTDTGLITLAVGATVPGLVMFDKPSQTWNHIERECDPLDVVVFIGGKVEMFSQSSVFEATPHRVTLAPDTERMVVVFLYDVAK